MILQQLGRERMFPEFITPLRPHMVTAVPASDILKISLVLGIKVRYMVGTSEGRRDIANYSWLQVIVHLLRYGKIYCGEMLRSGRRGEENKDTFEIMKPRFRESWKRK